MANVNITEILTKIVLRNDVLSAWEASTIVLEKGEPAVIFDSEKGTAKIKIGDGVSPVNDLPYSTVSPTEVQEMISSSMGEIGAVNTVSLSSGTENGTLKITINGTEYDNIAVTGLGSAAYTESSEYATAEQGTKADKAMSFIGLTDVLPTENLDEGNSYKATDTFTIATDLSYTNIETTVVTGDIIVLMDNNKWLVIPCGAAETAKSLVEGISANVTGGVTGSAEAANAGETIEISVTEVNTDYLVCGEKTIILNGGTAVS